MKQIGFKISMLLGLLLTLISCAEEGPYRLGELEYDIEMSQITPTTAVVSVKIPQNADNLLESQRNRPLNVDLFEKFLLTNGEIPSQEYGISTSLISGSNGSYKFFFKNLTPNYTYYVRLGTYVNYNRQSEYERQDIMTNYSFTTAHQGDYSGLGKAKCELISNIDEMTRVKFLLPEGMYFPAGQLGDEVGNLNAVRAYASTSPDMSNAVESMLKVSFSQTAADEFYFRGLENTTYYFQLKGSFYSSIALDYNFRDYFWTDVTLDVGNPLDLDIQ